MTSTKSPAMPATASRSAAPTVVRPPRAAFASGCCALLAFAALAFAQTGCSSEPLSSDLATILPETERAFVGYNETDYVYPIRVPNTNRYVQMRVKEPLDRQPTYEDYLEWKKNN